MDNIDAIKNNSTETGTEKSSEGREQGKSPEIQGVKGSVVPPTLVDDTDTNALSSALSSNTQDGATGKDSSSPQPKKVKVGSSVPYVKKAAKVIEADKGNPYKEEEDLEDIQIEYLKDRFGKDLKKS